MRIVITGTGAICGVGASPSAIVDAALAQQIEAEEQPHRDAPGPLVEARDGAVEVLFRCGHAASISGGRPGVPMSSARPLWCSLNPGAALTFRISCNESPRCNLRRNIPIW